MYGHIHRMAEAMVEGVKEVSGAEVELRRVPETLSEEILGKMGALEAQKAFSHVPVATVDELTEADAIIFGTPTRFGNMCGQMRQFLDATGQLWASGALVGNMGARNPRSSVFILHFFIKGLSLSACPMLFKARCVLMKSPAALPMVHQQLPAARAKECRAKMNWQQHASKVSM
jgi:hypothetical protein